MQIKVVVSCEKSASVAAEVNKQLAVAHFELSL